MALGNLQEADVQKLQQYLERVLGVTLEMGPPEDRKAGLLPVYLAKGYTYYLGSIQSQKVVFALPAEGTESTAQKLKKDAAAISNVFLFPVVFVFDSLESYKRVRLVHQKVPFIVPERQLYIPFLIISFTDTPGKIKLPLPERLRPASQCLLLYHLEIGKLGGINFQSIAKSIAYSPMTVKRAAEELHAYGLTNITGKREKFLSFNLEGRALWEKALPYLNSPVKISFYISELPAGVKLLRAHDQALSDYTDLAAGGIPTFAIAVDDLKNFEGKLKVNDIDYFGGNIKIEVWNYDPVILSKDKVVDRLSLYLSMPRYGLDERTIGALDDLINDHVW